MKYKVALRKSDDGYSVSVPGLPGCWSHGATEAEALANIEDAIRQYLEVAAERAVSTTLRILLHLDARWAIHLQRRVEGRSGAMSPACL